MIESSLDKEGSSQSFWEEAEIEAVIAEVQSRKSVDSSKLFGGPNGVLPDALSRRSASDSKEKVDRCKSAFDPDIAPWVPKCGVAELVAVLASEAVFCRVQRRKLAELREQLQTDKKERMKVEISLKEAKKELQDLLSQLDAETKMRHKVEKEKVDFQEELARAKSDVDEEILRRQQKEREFDEIKLKEIDSRRRLDRARLKVAALRGELVSPAMDALVRPEFLDISGDSLGIATTAAVAGELFQKVERITVEERPSLSSVTNPSSLNEKGSTKDESDYENFEKLEKMDVEKPVESAENSSKPANSSHANEDVDSKLPSSPKDREIASTASGVGSDASHVTSGGLGGDMDLLSESVMASEEVEDEKMAEFRLLRNRLAMHMAEAEDWQSSAAAERRKAKLIKSSKARLEEDVNRYTNVGSVQSRGHARVRTKRAVPLPDSTVIPGDNSSPRRGEDAANDNNIVCHKRRKSCPQRALILST